jgi:hypothetical protein
LGRYFSSKKDTVEDCISLSIIKLRQWDYLCGFRAGSIQWKNSVGEVTSSIGIAVSVSREEYGQDYVRLSYSQADRFTREKRNDLDYNIELVSTPCHFGGLRYWFVCPLVRNGTHCGRRVGKLYLPGGQSYFGCRHCYDLTYKSCQESDKRESALMKLPPEELKRLLNNHDPKATILGMKALLKKFK